MDTTIDVTGETYVPDWYYSRVEILLYISPQNLLRVVDLCDLGQTLTTGEGLVFSLKTGEGHSLCFVYIHEEIERDLNRILIYECRCYERLNLCTGMFQFRKLFCLL